MRKIRRAFIVTVFVLSAVLLSLQPARAQMLPDYAFLEVLDSKGKPVPDASVESRGNISGSLKTNENGKVRFEAGRDPRNLTSSLFTISKAGYFTFFDLGFYGQGSCEWEKYVQLELLKIPQTKAERKARAE